MKKYLLLFIAVAISVAANAQFNSSKDPFITQSLAGKSIQKVYARTSGGAISVTGSATDEPKLEIYVRSNNGITSLSKEEIQQRLNEDYVMTISTDNNVLSVVVKRKDSTTDWKKEDGFVSNIKKQVNALFNDNVRSLSVSFKITVPEKVANDLGTSGGSISLANLSGDQKFSTSGGSLNVDKLTGNIDGKTSGGSITVANSKGDHINLQTSGGSIKAENCDGTISLGTSGGSLTLTKLKGSVRAHTSGGSIRADNIDGELVTNTSGGSINLSDMSASVDASTSGGSINVTLTQLGKYIKLHSSGGSINVNVPQNAGLTLDLHGNKIHTGTMKNFNGNTSDRSLNGTVNGGGIPVTVNGNGNVTLNWR